MPARQRAPISSASQGARTAGYTLGGVAVVLTQPQAVLAGLGLAVLAGLVSKAASARDELEEAEGSRGFFVRLLSKLVVTLALLSVWMAIPGPARAQLDTSGFDAECAALVWPEEPEATHVRYSGEEVPFGQPYLERGCTPVWRSSRDEAGERHWRLVAEGDLARIVTWAVVGDGPAYTLDADGEPAEAPGHYFVGVADVTGPGQLWEIAVPRPGDAPDDQDVAVSIATYARAVSSAGGKGPWGWAAFRGLRFRGLRLEPLRPHAPGLLRGTLLGPAD